MYRFYVNTTLFYSMYILIVFIGTLTPMDFGIRGGLGTSTPRILRINCILKYTPRHDLFIVTIFKGSMLSYEKKTVHNFLGVKSAK